MSLFRVGLHGHQLFVRFVFAIAAVSATDAVAGSPDDWLCTGTQSCGDGCADERLTGPLYQPSEPMMQNNVEPFLQPSNPSSSLFAEGVEGTLAANGHAPGYIDWAMPRTQLRLRFDSGWDSNKPDRAEYFYAQYGGPGPGDANIIGAGTTRADFHDIRAYLEIAASDRFSVFGEVPVRFLELSSSPQIPGFPDGSENGVGDLEAGFKYALSTDPRNFLTFQLKTYIPTGNARRGLGTDHVSIEPGFLYQSRVSNRLDIFAELRDWIPIDGSQQNGQDYAGNVLRYGIGAAYTAVETRNVQISPITELVGWSVLDGLVYNSETGVLDAQSAATTIVNAKVGLRTLFKGNGSTLYVGYGNCLTGQRWYEDFLRIEYTIFL